MFNASSLSREAKAVCKAMHFTPRQWEPLNVNQDDAVEQPVMRVWNSKREILITNRDLEYAGTYL
jgi:hypothetical protein